MTIQFIDLTEDSSADENSFGDMRATIFKSKAAVQSKHSKPARARAPLQQVTNNVPSLSEYIPKTDINPALVRAINIATIERLREMLKMICYENVESRKLVEAQFLVTMKKVPLYHADTASEADNESIPPSVERSSESESDGREENEGRGEEKPTRICDRLLQGIKPTKREQEKERELLNKLVNDGHKALESANQTQNMVRNYLANMEKRDVQVGAVSRDIHKFPVCVNCGKTFNPETNREGICIWHEEKYKIPDEDHPIWADHDEDCHGTYDSFESDPRYAAGFLWGCCEGKITDEGCMSTRHEAPATCVPPSKPATQSPDKKRKATAKISSPEMFPRFSTCQNCKEEFDTTENEPGDCIWHWGEKEINGDSYIWDEHDEDIYSRATELENDPAYADGYLWTCCQKMGSAAGCRKTKHQYLDHPRKKVRY